MSGTPELSRRHLEMRYEWARQRVVAAAREGAIEAAARRALP